MPGPRRTAKTAAAAAIENTNPKRRRLNPGADTRPVQTPVSAAIDATVNGTATAAAASTDAALNDSMSHSSRNSLVEFLNGWHTKSIQPGRELQKTLLDEQDQPHPALQHARNPNWSEADEARAEALWQAEKEQWKMFASSQGYTTLWKICLQFANCSPWDIVGERTRLCFKPDNTPHARVSSGRMWSDGFCTALARLVTHIVWPSHFDGALAMNIAAAVQYAVILRTNDQRPMTVGPGSW